MSENTLKKENIVDELAVKKEELKEFMLKEIEIIQDIIKRMASNSFAIKRWTIALVIITLLLKGSKYQVLLAFIPILVFWFLDAYFLWQERLYRRLYNWVIKNRMNTDEYLFDMNAYRFKDGEQSIWTCPLNINTTLVYYNTRQITYKRSSSF